MDIVKDMGRANIKIGLLTETGNIDQNFFNHMLEERNLPYRVYAPAKGGQHTGGTAIVCALDIAKHIDEKSVKHTRDRRLSHLTINPPGHPALHVVCVYGDAQKTDPKINQTIRNYLEKHIRKGDISWF